MTEQSTPSSDPPAQPQQSFGAPPPQQAAGSEPAPTESFGAAPPTPPPAAAEAFGVPPAAAPVKKRRPVLMTVVIVLVVLLALCIGAGALLARAWLQDSAANAKVGDCLGNAPSVGEGEDKEATDVKVVSCDSSDAVYKVEVRFEDKTRQDVETACAEYANAPVAIYFIEVGKTGPIMCLSEVTN